jgi:Xaa-Pro aminopeptidase
MKPTFDASFFTENRSRLSQSMPGCLMVISAHALLQFSADQAFPFRQDSNFWFACGINEPDLVLTIDTSTNEAILYLPEQSEYHDEWDGAYDTTDFRHTSGIKKFEQMRQLVGAIKHAKENGRKIGILTPLPERVEPYGFYANPARAKLAQLIAEVEPNPEDIRQIFARVRQVKQPQEIRAIQLAIDATADALIEAQSFISSHVGKDIYEKDVEHILSRAFVQTGGHAYEPIIASGKNASKNSQPIKQNAFLLLDVGAKVFGYSADISRTWFVGKNITDRYKQLYGAVLEIQTYAFGQLKPGVRLKEYQTIVEQFAFKKFKTLDVDLDRYPHGFSHFLGLDTHDAGDYSEPLLENSIITVEPGLYLPDEGIGIRIEDDVRITKTGIEVMSKQIPSDLLYL